MKSGLRRDPTKPSVSKLKVLFFLNEIKKRIKINSIVNTENPKIDDQVKPKNK